MDRTKKLMIAITMAIMAAIFQCASPSFAGLLPSKPIVPIALQERENLDLGEPKLNDQPFYMDASGAGHFHSVTSEKWMADPDISPEVKAKLRELSLDRMQLPPDALNLFGRPSGVAYSDSTQIKKNQEEKPLSPELANAVFGQSELAAYIAKFNNFLDLKSLEKVSTSTRDSLSGSIAGVVALEIITQQPIQKNANGDGTFELPVNQNIPPRTMQKAITEIVKRKLEHFYPLAAQLYQQLPQNDPDQIKEQIIGDALQFNSPFASTLLEAFYFGKTNLELNRSIARAVARGQLEFVKDLVAHGASLNQALSDSMGGLYRDVKKVHLLERALLIKHLPLAQFIIETLRSENVLNDGAFELQFYVFRRVIQDAILEIVKRKLEHFYPLAAQLYQLLPQYDPDQIKEQIIGEALRFDSPFASTLLENYYVGKTNLELKRLVVSAVVRGQLEFVKDLVAHGASLDYRSMAADGVYPDGHRGHVLEHALKIDDLPLAQFIVDTLKSEDFQNDLNSLEVSHYGSYYEDDHKTSLLFTLVNVEVPSPLMTSILQKMPSSIFDHNFGKRLGTDFISRIATGLQWNNLIEIQKSIPYQYFFNATISADREKKNIIPLLEGLTLEKNPRDALGIDRRWSSPEQKAQRLTIARKLVQDVPASELVQFSDQRPGFLYQLVQEGDADLVREFVKKVSSVDCDWLTRWGQGVKIQRVRVKEAFGDYPRRKSPTYFMGRNILELAANSKNWEVLEFLFSVIPVEKRTEFLNPIDVEYPDGVQPFHYDTWGWSGTQKLEAPFDYIPHQNSPEEIIRELRSQP